MGGGGALLYTNPLFLFLRPYRRVMKQSTGKSAKRFDGASHVSDAFACGLLMVSVGLFVASGGQLQPSSTKPSLSRA